MIDKVWTIENDECGLIGVYSTRSGAEDVVAALGCGTIVERVCDPGVAEIRGGLHMYRVVILRDGYVEKCEDRILNEYDISGSADIWRRSLTPVYCGQDRPDVLVVETFARDGEHAVKIANETRAQMIALGQWPELSMT